MIEHPTLSSCGIRYSAAAAPNDNNKDRGGRRADPILRCHVAGDDDNDNGDDGDDDDDDKDDDCLARDDRIDRDRGPRAPPPRPPRI